MEGEPGASSAIRDALAWIVDHLQQNPFMGSHVENARRSDVRRFYLDRIGYHIFYRVDQRRARVVIVTFWHERRRPPRL